MPDWRILTLVFGGTVWIYGLDRLLESLFLEHTEPRHHPRPAASLAMSLLGSASVLLAIPWLTAQEWRWLAILALGGGSYLFFTAWPQDPDYLQRKRSAALANTAKASRGVKAAFAHFQVLALQTAMRILDPLTPLVGIPLIKEALGAGCYSWLVLGLLEVDQALWFALMLTAFSNFLWSSQADALRDQANLRPSVAVRAPAGNRLLARGSALLAAFLWESQLGINNLFLPVALLHFAWPNANGDRIDLAFLPLTAVLLLHAPV